MPQRKVLRCLVVLSFIFSCCCAQQARGVSCSVQAAPTDAASKAFADEKYSDALQLYADAAKKNPQDSAAIAGQVRTLLEMNAVDAAAKIAETNAAAHPGDALFAVTLGEVRFRQGDMQAATAQYTRTYGLDPCLPRLHYDIYRLLWARSMRASAYGQLKTANQLMPDDPDIHYAWINHLPLTERVTALDTYLTKDFSGSKESHDDLVSMTDRLHAILSAQSGGCRLETGASTTTTLPFQYLMEPNNIQRFQGLGFDVHVDGKASARLELDTGASGILLNRITAKKAGLVPIASDKVGGIGDKGETGGYWAYADSIQVGSLNFHHCLIEVSDQRSIVNVDGLIGTDTFENFHVSLDMPLRQMTLSPLPPRPGEAVQQVTLNAAGVSDAVAASEGKDPGAQVKASIQYHDPYVATEMTGWIPFYRFGHEILLPGLLKDQKPRLFLLDTGSNRSNLSTEAARSLGKLHANYDYTIKGISGNVEKVYQVDRADLIFANFVDPLRNIPAFTLDNVSKNTGTELSGIIGMDTLVMLTIDIDYRDGLIHLGYDPKRGNNVWLK